MTDNKLIDDLNNDNIPIFNVSKITKEIRNLLENKYSYVKIKGEFSKIKLWNGHIFTSLKEGEEVIDVVIWKNKLAQLEIEPKEGDEVVCSGSISAKNSKYQLVLDRIAYEGEGQLLKKKEELKKKLQKEGLFEDKHKKKLPYIPNLIGIITSKSGSVLHEMEKIINERFSVNRILYPVTVQGKILVKEIISAIEYFNNSRIKGVKADVLIIARGGGSIEDLWYFNDEDLCRAVFNSKIPIISAIGHEPDTNLIDYVADHRAATPSEAAVIVVPDRKELVDKLNKIFERFQKALLNFFKEKSVNIEQNFNKLRTPQQVYIQKKKESAQIMKRYKNVAKIFISSKEEKLKNLSKLLEIVSPDNILKRGYTYIKDSKSDTYIKNAIDIKSKLNIKIKFHDGTVEAITKKK
ncbi:MAG: Exodeoxyribonuclease 7 large subunit [Alphaproteobacteria bacterium MarineAlpha6_Bin3]|nr:MAG: Exodeoxyribonuclease 7 large subunit [Alphaproteobacteria bacterium MarineAlpha6_Bin3]|tara:strand:+ start:14269 stop:15492 length:1224 start_codon:yes stop_codon:yes gene_type:complete